MDNLRLWATLVADHLYLFLALFVPGEREPELRASIRKQMWWDKETEETRRRMLSLDEPAFHPFSGLPMNGDVDTDGNLY